MNSEQLFFMKFGNLSKDVTEIGLELRLNAAKVVIDSTTRDRPECC